MAVTDTHPQSAPARLRVVAALLLRDLTVLRGNLGGFLARTLLQPLLLVFVLTYVFPLIGQGVGTDGAADFSAVLVAGVVANTILFQGILSVTLPLTHQLEGHGDLEDRILAPVEIPVVALQHILAGALECLLAGAAVFPIAALIPATDVPLSISWPLLLGLVPLACTLSAALGLLLGTVFSPRTTPVLFGVILVPVTFLGGMYFRWTDLDAIPWLQMGSLVNPLIYVSEGMRAAVTDGPHMAPAVIFGVLVPMTIAMVWGGVRRLTARVTA